MCVTILRRIPACMTMYANKFFQETKIEFAHDFGVLALHSFLCVSFFFSSAELFLFFATISILYKKR
jgi:hypothetical protein